MIRAESPPLKLLFNRIPILHHFYLFYYKKNTKNNDYRKPAVRRNITVLQYLFNKVPDRAGLQLLD